MFARTALRFLAETTVVVLAGALLAALLFRHAPGADIDLREADSRLSSSTVEELRAEKERSREWLPASRAYLAGLSRGDFGSSEISGRPVTEMMSERAPATAWLVARGSALSLAIAVAAAAFLSRLRGAGWAQASMAVSACFLALPSGLVVLLAIWLRLPVEAALVALVAPRLFGYAAAIFAAHVRSDFVLWLHAMGYGPGRIVLRHLLPAVLPELLALGTVAIVTSIAVALPVEVLGARPGLGELAWNAALNRDLPLVLGTTLVLIPVVRLATLVSRLALRGGPAGVQP